MSSSAIIAPSTDPTMIFEHFRGSYGTELLTAAVAHFHLFDQLEKGPKTWEELRDLLGLQSRPAHVLFTALRAMGLLVMNRQEKFELTSLAREHLLATSSFDVSGYIGLAAESPGVKEMVARLTTNRPFGAEEKETGAAFIYRDGIESAMEREATARHFTLALAGRAKNVAPVLANRLPLTGVSKVLDCGGGTGIYSIALLQKEPQLKAIVFDRPEVLKVAEEMAADYGVSDRLELVPGDMFRDPLPVGCDAVLLSNILHDWDVPECQALIHRCTAILPDHGRLWIHDVFLNDALDGPLAIALYSAALFGFTEGRAYSASEYRQFLAGAGWKSEEFIPTLVHCGVLVGTKG